MRQQFCKILCVVMALVFPTSSLMAEAPTALAQSRGTVTVNGKAVSGSFSVFDGEKIQTIGSDSTLSIVSNGTHIMVMGNSTVTYAQNNLSRLCGAVLVSTKAPETINGVTVTPSPANSSARYEFRQSRGSYQIAAREGSVAYNDGTGEKTLATNESANPMGGGEACGVEAAAAAENPAPVQGGVSAGGGLPHGVVWVAGAASVAAAIAIVEALGNRGRVSPSKP